MTTETTLTNYQIHSILHDNFLPFSTQTEGFARAIEQAVLQSLPVQTSSTIRGDSYAGVYIWFGSDNILQHIPKLLAENANDPQNMLDDVASECIKKLERHNVLKSPEVQALREDAALLDWLDAVNAPFLTGWRTSVTSFGNVTLHTVSQPCGEMSTIRSAIRAAMEQQK